VPISISKKMLGATVAAGVALVLAGCGQAPTAEPGGNGGGEEAASDFLSCIVSDAGGFDDKSFNQLSYEGVVRATDELGSEMKQAESNAETEYGPNIDNMVSEGCDAIVAVGFALSQATVDAATANPDTDFILVDDAADNDFDGERDAENVKPLLYNTAEAAFLAGYLSAGYSEAGKVGTFGGMEFPTVTIFMDGFKQGVDTTTARTAPRCRSSAGTARPARSRAASRPTRTPRPSRRTSSTRAWTSSCPSAVRSTSRRCRPSPSRAATSR